MDKIKNGIKQPVAKFYFPESDHRAVKNALKHLNHSLNRLAKKNSNLNRSKGLELKNQLKQTEKKCDLLNHQLEDVKSLLENTKKQHGERFKEKKTESISSLENLREEREEDKNNNSNIKYNPLKQKKKDKEKEEKKERKKNEEKIEKKFEEGLDVSLMEDLQKIFLLNIQKRKKPKNLILETNENTFGHQNNSKFENKNKKNSSSPLPTFPPSPPPPFPSPLHFSSHSSYVSPSPFFLSPRLQQPSAPKSSPSSPLPPHLSKIRHSSPENQLFQPPPYPSSIPLSLLSSTLVLSQQNKNKTKQINNKYKEENNETKKQKNKNINNNQNNNNIKYNQIKNNKIERHFSRNSSLPAFKHLQLGNEGLLNPLSFNDNPSYLNSDLLKVPQKPSGNVSQNLHSKIPNSNHKLSKFHPHPGVNKKPSAPQSHPHLRSQRVNRLQMKVADFPFIIGKSTGRSHSLPGNIQEIINLMNKKNIKKISSFPLNFHPHKRCGCLQTRPVEPDRCQKFMEKRKEEKEIKKRGGGEVEQEENNDKSRQEINKELSKIKYKFDKYNDLLSPAKNNITDNNNNDSKDKIKKNKHKNKKQIMDDIMNSKYVKNSQLIQNLRKIQKSLED